MISSRRPPPPGSAQEPDSPSRTTRLLARIDGGSPLAVQELTALLYDELRRIGQNLLVRERPDHTLQPTALVHEAFIRLVDQRAVSWSGRAHFLAIAARVMRRVLVDHARRRAAAKRDPRQLVTGWPSSGGDDDPLDVLALEDALTRLAERDERAARVVELRYFGGLEVEEAAEVLGVSARTVKRDWRLARAWLIGELEPTTE